MTGTNDRENTFREALFSGGMDLDGMDALLALYRELYPLRCLELEPEKDMKVPPEDEISMRLGEGFTLLDVPDLLSRAVDFSDQVKKAAGILAGHSEDPGSVTRTIKRLCEDPAVLHGLADAYVTDGDSVLREKTLSMDGANPEVVIFVVFNALTGLFLAAGHRFAEARTEPWDHGRCPVCGGEPSVAYLAGEGGKRFLICHRCETRWRFPRMVCPFCEEENPGESCYLFLEEQQYKTMTGQVCDRCKRYIKTWRVESDDLGLFHPEVEDLKTPAFDAAMESEGYRRGGANVFGLLMGLAVREDNPNGES